MSVSVNAPENGFRTLSVIGPQKHAGVVSGLLKTVERDQFQTQYVSHLDLDLMGIAGDRHAGFSRFSGGREPWYPRGTEICNERQISILSPEELSSVAERMEIERIEPSWIGGNLVIKGFKNLSLIPPRTRLVFQNGAVIRIDGNNAPCRIAGKSIADHYPDRPGIDLLFTRASRLLRGLVGYVEKAGTIKTDEVVTAHIPEQWIYNPDQTSPVSAKEL